VATLKPRLRSQNLATLGTSGSPPCLCPSKSTIRRMGIEQDWYQTVATWNPVSYMIEGIRSLVIEGWNGEALALAFASAGGIAAIAIAAAGSALRTRMVRT